MSQRLLNKINELTRLLTSGDQFSSMMDVIESADFDERERDPAVDVWKSASIHITSFPTTIRKRLEVTSE